MEITQELNSKLISSLRTKNNVILFLQFLQNAKRNEFKSSSIDSITTVAAESRSNFAELYEYILDNNNLGIGYNQSKNEFYAALEKVLKSLDCLEISVGFTFTTDFEIYLFDYLQKEFSLNKLINLKQDSNINGGLILVNNGIYIDMSLEKILKEYFTINSNVILSILHK